MKGLFKKIFHKQPASGYTAVGEEDFGQETSNQLEPPTPKTPGFAAQPLSPIGTPKPKLSITSRAIYTPEVLVHNRLLRPPASPQCSIHASLPRLPLSTPYFNNSSPPSALKFNTAAWVCPPLQSGSSYPPSASSASWFSSAYTPLSRHGLAPYAVIALRWACFPSRIYWLHTFVSFLRRMLHCRVWGLCVYCSCKSQRELSASHRASSSSPIQRLHRWLLELFMGWVIWWAVSRVQWDRWSEAWSSASVTISVLWVQCGGDTLWLFLWWGWDGAGCWRKGRDQGRRGSDRVRCCAEKRIERRGEGVAMRRKEALCPK